MNTDGSPQPQAPSQGRARVALVTAAASGGVLWVWAANAAGRLEAWDGPFYFSRVVPALALIAVICGFIAPRHPWRWPSTMYASQFVVMLARAEPPIGPLAPVGFILMAGLAAFTIVPAYVGAFARRAWNRRGAG